MTTFTKMVTYTDEEGKNAGFGTVQWHPILTYEEEARGHAWLAEIQKACERLRRFPDKNKNVDEQKPEAAALRWAINLASIDLSCLSVGQMSDLQYEFEALVTFEMNRPNMRLRNIEGPTYTDKTIARTQTWLKVTLSSLLDGGVIDYRPPAEVHQLMYMKDGNQLAMGLPAPGWVHMVGTTIGECPALFFRLITTHLDDLHRCNAVDCRAVFLRDRRDQLYCSKGCLWKTTMRRKRQTPVERFGKRGRPKKADMMPAPSMPAKKASKAVQAKSKSTHMTKPLRKKEMHHGKKK